MDLFTYLMSKKEHNTCKDTFSYLLGKGGGDTPPIPREYQQVEYIQSTGTQYINTNLDMSGGGKIEIQFNFPQMQSSYHNIYGCQLSASPWQTLCARTSGSRLEVYAYEKGSTKTLSKDTIYTLIHEFKNYVTTVTLNGTTTSGTGNVPITSFHLYLFANNEANHVGRFASVKLYYFKIYDANDNLLLDLVPCYRKNDEVVGLYDLASKTFKTNDGTGEFIKGGDI